MAALVRIELTIPESKSGALPLGYRAICIFTFCQLLILILPVFISTNHREHGNGLEVEILFSEIDLGIQSHATFCPYKFNTSYTALASRPLPTHHLPPDVLNY